MKEGRVKTSLGNLELERISGEELILLLLEDKTMAKTSREDTQSFCFQDSGQETRDLRPIFLTFSCWEQLPPGSHSTTK